MKTKEEIVENWLPRYTKRPLDQFDDYILLTNFNNYVEMFAEWFDVPVLGHVGDYILPSAAIRGEGTSNDYFPPEIPALPAFNLQRAVSSNIRDFGHDYWTGTVYTTNRRVWEHDEAFCNYLRSTRALAVDMETATLFSVGFHNSIPTGALLLVSDMPLQPDGIKTSESDKHVTANYVEEHLKIGIKSLTSLQHNSKTIKHLRFE